MKTNIVLERLNQLGKTVDDFADDIGVQKITMKQNFMRGQRPSAPVAKMMLQVLGLKPEELFYPEELEQIGLTGSDPDTAA